jgi:hypothetical protein
MSKKKAPAKKRKPASAKPKRLTVYAVQRVADGYDGPSYGEPERVFADRKAAAAFARELARAGRAILNPFHAGGPEDWITGGEKKLVEAVKKLGLKPPKVKKGYYYTDWPGWWNQTYYDMTEAQRDAVWDALNKLKLYQVVSTTLE